MDGKNVDLELVDAYSDAMFAPEIAIYPKSLIEGQTLVYPVLGLVDEIGELTEKYNSWLYLKTAWSKKVPTAEETKTVTDLQTELLKEAGDVYWYCNAITRALGYDFSTHSSWYDYMGVTVAPVPTKYVEHLNITQGVIAGQLKKYIRDNNEEKLDAMLESVNLVLRYLNRFVAYFNSTPNDIMNGNLEKLVSRQKRGKLTGDGDNR